MYSLAILEISSIDALESDSFLQIASFLIIFKYPALLDTFTTLKINFSFMYWCEISVLSRTA